MKCPICGGEANKVGNFIIAKVGENKDYGAWYICQNNDCGVLFVRKEIEK